MAALQLVEAAAPVQERRHLDRRVAFAAAPHADKFVVGERRAHEGRLFVIAAFLQPQQIGSKGADAVDHEVPAVRPAMLAVGGRRTADVEGHDLERHFSLGSGADCGAKFVLGSRRLHAVLLIGTLVTVDGPSSALV
jgi:hypothetical protein